MQARGIRYGYVYVTPIEHHTLVVGILPTIDQVGRVLWDGEWDFFVGSASLGGKIGEGDYRLGFYRIASDLKAGTIGTGFGKDGDMWVADYNRPMKLGAYDVSRRPLLQLESGQDRKYFYRRYENWAALAHQAALRRRMERLPHAQQRPHRLGLTGNNHTGYSGKFEGSVDRADDLLFALYASGDKAGHTSDQFTTPEAILGTNGYWGYSHIFNANAPGDVNDFTASISITAGPGS
ncbi:MAG: hypothetical protein MRJ92_02290 [Nitrospira sp.]|nr:hypothetical protein [Nitrospira sp.]